MYADYLRASCGATTATGLSQRREGEVSHDQVPRDVAGKPKTAAELGLTVKPFVPQVPAEPGGLLLDDSIKEKPYPDEHDLGCGPCDPAQERLLKGLNFRTARYSRPGVRLPVGFHVGAKTETDLDPKTQTEQRRSPVATPAAWRERLQQAVTTLSPVRLVVFAVGVASAATRVFLKPQQTPALICPLKTTRKVALRVAAQPPGRYPRGATLELAATAPRRVSLAGGDFPLLLLKPVFTNADGSLGLLSLVSSETPLSFAELTPPYPTRGPVECSPKSLPQKVAVAQSPPPPVTTPTTHGFAALCGFSKWERRKGKTPLTPFALKAKLYLTALHSAFSTLRHLTPLQDPA